MITFVGVERRPRRTLTRPNYRESPEIDCDFSKFQAIFIARTKYKGDGVFAMDDIPKVRQ